MITCIADTAKKTQVLNPRPEFPVAINSHSYTHQLNHALRHIQLLQSQLKSHSNSAPLRWLKMHEHRPILEEALKNSQDRLLIISPWIRSTAVNPWFLKNLENLLNKGVFVYIGYGLGEKDENLSLADIDAEKKLERLAKQFPKKFTLKWLGDTHAKILISDSKFAITTSFNWLSFRGAKNRDFRDERGTLVSDPRKVKELFNSLMQQF